MEDPETDESFFKMAKAREGIILAFLTIASTSLLCNFEQRPILALPQFPHL